MDRTAPAYGGPDLGLPAEGDPAAEATAQRAPAPPGPSPAEVRGVAPAGGRRLGERPAVVTEHADFAALRADWDDLWSRCPSATPFQAHAWADAWARAYVPDGRLAVVAVWDGDVLVAAAALHRTRRGPVPVLAPLGGEISDSTDVLLDPGVPDAGPRLAAALLGLRGWRALDLPEVLPSAAAQPWARGWPGRVRRSEASINLQIPALPVADALGRVPARTASTLRRKIRKVEQLGVVRTEVTPGEVPRAVADLVRLHEAQWAGRRGNPEHLTDRFRAFLTAALPPMIERGQAVFVEYRVDGELVAAEVDLVGHDTLSYYLAGISPALRQRIDTAVLLVTGALDRAGALGKVEYSFLRGLEDYKFRWRPDEVRATRILLARPGPLGSAGYVLATTACQGFLAAARRILRGRARDLARSAMHVVRVRRSRT